MVDHFFAGVHFLVLNTQLVPEIVDTSHISVGMPDHHFSNALKFRVFPLEIPSLYSLASDGIFLDSKLLFEISDYLVCFLQFSLHDSCRMSHLLGILKGAHLLSLFSFYFTLQKEHACIRISFLG